MNLARARMFTGAVVAATLYLLACEGGGTGCGGCGGAVAPIPGGYPAAARIPNAAQVRVTKSGLGFVADNFAPILTSLLPGGLDFPFMKTNVFSVGPVDVTLCDDNDCSAHIELKSIKITPKAPNRLVVSIQAIVDSRDGSGPPGVKSTWDGTCDVKVDTRLGSRDYIAFKAEIALESETEPARAGYTYAKVISIGADDAASIQGDDLQVSGGFAGICGLGNFNFFKNFVLGLVVDPITDMLTGVIDDQLCMKEGVGGCPDGTFAVEGDGEMAVCRYSNSESARCVPMLLGTEGQGDLGDALLGGFSPGTHGNAQFSVAAGGAGEAVSEGLSLFMFGGLRSMDPSLTTSPAHASCVPLLPVPALPTIPRAGAFRGNVIPGTADTTHVAIGISEQFLNYAGYGIYDSGMLCIAAGTRLSQQLSSGLFSLLVGSLKDLAFPDGTVPIAIAIRPQTPPTFEVGAGTDADPLLTLKLTGVSADFYIWHTERYVRFMTFTGDLAVDLNLTVSDNKVSVGIGKLTAANTTVTNSDLLEEPPAELANIIESVLTGFAGTLADQIPPFELPSFMGFNLNVPENGVMGVEDSGDEFLSIFANLSLANPNTAVVNTEATLRAVNIDPVSLAAATFGQGARPEVLLSAQASGRDGASFEYSARVDHGGWSPWTTDADFVVSDSQLLLQGRHDVQVRARVAGAARTTDPTPAQLEVLVDAVPPTVIAERRDDGVHIQASDFVSPAEALEVRVHLAESGWGPWSVLGKGAFVNLAFDDQVLGVEVRDESENVTATTAALIRGAPDPNRAKACDCTIPGGDGGPVPRLPLLFVLVMGVFALGRRRLRRLRWTRLLGVSSLLAIVLTVSGCSCSDSGPKGPCGGACVAAEPMSATGAICCPSTDMCIDYNLDSFCDPGSTCDGPESLVLDGACGLTCKSCVVKPALSPGDIGTYMDVAVGDDGTVMVSGYEVGVAPSLAFGDLAVGPWNAATNTVDWALVDGAPESPITNDPAGWRGGVSAAGDDVGRWTSIAAQGGQYYVAYYDRTHGALKMAIKSATGWAIHTVDDAGDAGSHASLVINGAGLPVVAYVRVANPGDGTITGSVVAATATNANPASAADWTFATVISQAIPCRPAWCGEGFTCLKAGGCVTVTDDCTADCGKDSACVGGACEDALPTSYVEDLPPAVGLYSQLARTSGGLALVYYDRSQGTLFGARFDGVSWGTPFVIDGYASNFSGAGDSGIGASLAVDGSDVWHVAYADGSAESLKYANVSGNIVTVSTVDDGGNDGATAYTDGRHIVGNDTSIAVTAGGEVRIVYQDATNQTAMLARKAAGGPWTHGVLDADKHTGYWLKQLVDGETSRVWTWWRGAGGTSENGTRLLNVAAP